VDHAVEQPDVATGREGLAGSGEHDGPGVAIGGQLGPDPGDLTVQALVRRVEGLRPVQRDDSHRATYLDEQLVGPTAGGHSVSHLERPLCSASPRRWRHRHLGLAMLDEPTTINPDAPVDVTTHHLIGGEANDHLRTLPKPMPNSRAPVSRR
jgi:hypothetical protein